MATRTDRALLRCETATVGQLVHRAVACFREGYVWHVADVLPEHKDPHRLDEKMVEQNEILDPRTDWRQVRQRKDAEETLVLFIRCGHFHVQFATRPTYYYRHRFWRCEGDKALDVRSQPLIVPLQPSGKPRRRQQRLEWSQSLHAAYEIQISRDGRPPPGSQSPKSVVRVRIETEYFGQLQTALLLHATAAESWWSECWHHCPFAPYAPIRQQVWRIWRAVNRERKRLGRKPLPESPLHTWQRDWHRRQKCNNTERTFVRWSEAVHGMTKRESPCYTDPDGNRSQ